MTYGNLTSTLLQKTCYTSFSVLYIYIWTELHSLVSGIAGGKSPDQVRQLNSTLYTVGKAK